MTTARAALAGATLAATASAADVYWDPGGNAANNNATTGAGLGGSGAWDTSTLTWWNGVSSVADQPWNDAANDRAVFWGPAPGTVTLDGPRTASGLVFKTNGYGLLGNFLTLGGPATIQTDAGVNATLSPVLLGASGLTKTGAGTLFVNNINNEFTGPVTVNGGVLAFSHESLTPNDKAQLGRVPTSNATVGSGITLNGGTLRAEMYQGGQGPPPPATLGPTRRIDLTAAGGTLDVVAGVILGLGADGGGALASGGIYTTAGGHLTKTGAGRVAISKNTNTAPHSFVGLTVRQGIWSIFQTDAVVGGTGGNPLGAQPPASPPNATEARKYALRLDYNGLGGDAVLRFRGLTDPGGTARTDVLIGNNRTILIGAGGGTIDTNGSATSHGGVGGVSNSGAFSGILALNAPGTGTLTKVNDGEFFHGGDASYGALVVNRGSWAVANELQLGSGSAASPAINVTLDTAGTGSQPATLRVVQANVNMAASHTLTIGPGGGTICTDNAGVVWKGPLAGSGTLTKAGYTGLVASPFIGDSAGAGTLTLGTDSPGFSGGIVVRAGTLVAASALKLGNDTSPGNTLTLDGGTFRAAASHAMNRAVMVGAAGGTVDTLANHLTLAGVVSGPGNIAKTGAGTLRLSGVNTHTGGTTVNAGTLVAGNPDALAGGNLTVNNATAQAQPSLPKAVTVNTLTLSGTGKVDLTDNDLVIKSSTLAAVQAQITAGYNNGTWDGAGINSSSAANDPNADTALGFFDNAEVQLTSFSGVTLTGPEILVKYTYYGDADLTGIVDTDDFQLFLAGYQDNTLPRTWFYGDFDYTGVIDTDDFQVFLYGYQNQGSALSALSEAVADAEDITEADRAFMQAAIAAVPEPAPLSVLGVAGVALVFCRRARGRMVVT